VLHGFDDPPERALPPSFRPGFEHAGLVDGSGEHACPRTFSTGIDSPVMPLIDKRVPSGHRSIPPEYGPRANNHNVAARSSESSARSFPLPNGLRHLRQQIQQIANGASAAPHGHPFKNLGYEYEQGDQKRRGKLSDGGSRARAMVMESSMVILRSSRSAKASLKMG